MRNPPEVKIEKNVPRPNRDARNAYGRWSAALKRMKVDDSFIYTGKAVSNMYIYSKVAGITIATHRLPDGTYRIWRTA